MTKKNPSSDPTAAFRAKKRRQIALLLCGLPFIAVVGWFKLFPDQLNDGVAGAMALIALGYILFAVIFSRLNWRCPCCQAWLGTALSPRSCPGCGTRLGQ